MHGYTKLFSRILTSTIWSEDDSTRIVWITMLALKDRAHKVYGTVPGLARIANVPTEGCHNAITKLSLPDPASSSKVADGARIRTIEGGWEIINGQKYHELLSLEERRDYKTQWEREKRRKKSTLSKSGRSGHIQETREKRQETKKNITPLPPSRGDVDSYFLELGFAKEQERFFDFYTSNGWKVGKNPMKDWKASARNWVRDKVPQKGTTTPTRELPPLTPDLTPEQIEKNRQFASDMVRKVKDGLRKTGSST